MSNGLDPIADDEFLYRRVPASAQPQLFDPVQQELNDQAFAPSKTRDVSGLSVSRAKYKAIEEAGQGRPGKSYYVAVLRAGDLRQHGIVVEPRPKVNDPGHAELPQLNAENYKDSDTLERQRLLVSLCLRVEGPFTTPGA
ncbi:MAG: hypothetical protein ACR2FY_13580 [Pirellulaceae bacterium]